jgi:hypothetical protein
MQTELDPPPARRWFDRVVAPRNDDPNEGLYRLFVWASVALSTVLGLFVVVRAAGVGADTLGQTGDFIGGMLNPLLSFVAFLGVLYSISLQRRDFRIQREDLAATQAEARLQKDALARQGFEATFFRMLSLHQEVLNSIDLIVSKPKGAIRGRDCFRTFHTRLEGCYGNQVRAGKPEAEAIVDGYADFWGQHSQEMGHYFRYLFNICRFVHQANVPTLPDEVTKPSVKYRYMRILRAQLSDFELAMLFYNMHTENGEKFKFYSREYNLLDNMPYKLAFSITHLEEATGMGPIGKFSDDE